MKVKVKLIQDARKIRFSQEEMGHFLDISQSQYSKLENGEATFDVKQLGILCDVLELNPLDVLEFTEKQQVYINQHNAIGTNMGDINSPLVNNDRELIRKIVKEELEKLK